MNTDVGQGGGGHSRAGRIILAAMAAAVVLLLIWAVSAVCSALAVVKSVSVVEESGSSPYTEQQIIEAAGIAEGMRCRDIDAVAAARRLEQTLPFIKQAVIKKRFGGSVEIRLQCQSAKYISDIAGEQYLLSEDFRVLGTGAVAGDVIPLRLPQVKQAMVGQQLQLFDNGEYIDVLLAALYASPLAAALDSVDTADRYSLRILYGGRFTVRLGDISELEAKLELVVRLLNEATLADAEQATIDVSDPAHPTVKRAGG